jgi:hypothetical protein
MALVAHGALRRIPALFGPRLVFAPNMPVLLALILCLSPAAVLLGTLTVGFGVISGGC